MFGMGLSVRRFADEGEDDAARDRRAMLNRRRFIVLSDPQWQAVKDRLGACVELRDRGGDARRCVEAALSVMVGNCRWSQLPGDAYGDWKIAYNRTERWIERGVWTSLVRSQALEESWGELIVAYIERRARYRAARSRRRPGRRICPGEP